MIIERDIESRRIVLVAQSIGDDLLVVIHGGDESHIGGVSLAFPSKSHYRNVDTISLNTISSPGHKDYVLSNKVAEKIGKHTGSSVAVLVGIHIQDATKHQIDEVVTKVNEMADELIRALGNKGNIGRQEIDGERTERED